MSKLTKAHLVSILTLLLFICTALCAQAEPAPQNLKYLQIEKSEPDGTTAITGQIALIKTYSDVTISPDIWVPFELLRSEGVPIMLNPSKTSFVMRIDSPAVKLGIPALAQFAPQTLELIFGARSEGELRFFNLRGMEKLTGIYCTMTDRNTLLISSAPPISEDIVSQDSTSASVELPEIKQPFNLVWDHIRDDNPDISAESALPGVSVLSPTWFELSDEAGTLTNKAGIAYVDACHKKGYHVWALVTNGFKRERTTKFLASRAAQNVFIARMLAYASIYGFDGINIDFENIANSDAAALTEFVRLFTAAGQSMGLVMTIDIMIPSNWSKCYERDKLAEIVDYIAVMTYDEHWRTSPKAGSTASLPWVRSAVANTLKDVPAEKLLLGIPLYTREWEETPLPKGRTSLKSKALSMTSVDLRIEENKAVTKWLSGSEQNFVQFQKGGKSYKIWIEDKSSVALRMDLVIKHGLAGAAFWRKGFEKPEIWELVESKTTK